MIGDIDDVFPELKQHNDSGWDIFVVVNDSTGYTNADVTGIRAVFMDFDNPDGLEAASPKLDWPLDPMMVIQTSPAKYHYYFGIGNGIEVVSIEDFNRITKAMLSAHPEMDKAVVRPCNLMRVPGFVNNKGKDGFKAKIISREPHQIYEVGDFLEQYPVLERAVADVQRLEGVSEDIASTDEADRARNALKSIDISKLPVGQDGHDIRMRMDSHCTNALASQMMSYTAMADKCGLTGALRTPGDSEKVMPQTIVKSDVLVSGTEWMLGRSLKLAWVLSIRIVETPGAG